MGTFNGIIGRQREIALLQEIYESPRAEFVAVYGRRRIGRPILSTSSLAISTTFI